MRGLSRWFKHLILVVAVLGLLTSAWPSVAQGNTPPAQPELKDFLEKRLHEISDVEPNHLRQDDSNQPAASSDSMWTIATLARQAAHPSIAVDVASHLHLSFASATGLTYAYFDGTTWQYTTVESAPFDSVIATAIALTPAGQPRIAYSLNGLKYAYLDQTGWHTELIDTAADTVDLAIDAGGTPHVGYNNSEIRLADRDNAGWHIMTLDSSGQSVSLRTGNSLYIGNLHMTYILPGGVEYAWNYAPRGEWHKYLYVSDPNARYSSMAAFYNGEAMQLAYCSCAGNASLHMDYWDYNDIHRNEVVDGGTPNWTGGDLSLAAYADRQYIAYFATDTGPHLKYAYKINNIWTLEIIDDQVNLSPSTVITPEVALAFNTAGRAYTVYNDGDGVLKYAVRRPAMATWVDLTFGSYRDNNWEVYTARADGRNQARRTIDPTYDSTPKFNRGASQIAFVSARNGNYEIYTMNADGSGQTRRTTTSANEYQPVWSPDGSKIAFYSYRDGNAEIYVMNANGSNQTRLTSNSAWDGHPAWAPDGAQLIFSSNRSGTDDLWIMNTNGTNQHQLTFGLNAAYPDWSPDGSKIIFNDDTNHDGWLDIAIVDVTGGNLLHPLGYSPVNYDYAAPTWSPIGQDYAFAKIQWVYYQGNYYWIDAYLYAVVEGITNQLTTSGVDWWPNWQPTDVWPPSSHIKTLPAFLGTSQFTVEWSGIDTGASDVMSYDIQYRDGANGVWTDWLTATNQTSAAFTGQYGHTYYFRSRAGDFAGNTEPYPGGNGDTSTTVYQYSLTDQVLGNRDQPVAAASITTGPSAINTGLSRHDGLFDLYFASGGIYTLTTTRNAFGVLPPLFNVSVPLSMSLPPLYLPPLDDLISDGHFESGNLSAWNPIGLLTPTITSTTHTGHYAALLGGIVPSDTVSSGPYLSAIEQMITVPLTLTDGTLSLLYKVTAADPLSDTFTAYLIGPTETLTFALPVTVTDWTHQWFDVSAWTVPTATLRLELSTPDKDRAIGVLVDEITWGSSIVGSRPIYLPVMHR